MVLERIATGCSPDHWSSALLWRPASDTAHPGSILVSVAQAAGPGRLYLSSGSKIIVSPVKIGLKTWHHVALVREGRQVAIYLDGNPVTGISGEAAADASFRPASILVGGRDDVAAGFEGKIDEVAVFDRALEGEEIARHFRASSND